MRDLLSYLHCRLEPTQERHGECARVLSRVRPGRFRMDRLSAPDNDTLVLLREVRDALLCHDATITLSATRLAMFYRDAIPAGVHLPCVVRIGATSHAWFVPNTDRTRYTSCLQHSEVLANEVLVGEALAPRTAWDPRPPAGPPSDAMTVQELESIARLVGWLTRDVRSGRLTAEDRTALEDAVVNVLRDHVRRHRGAAPPVPYSESVLARVLGGADPVC